MHNYTALFPADSVHTVACVSTRQVLAIDTTSTTLDVVVQTRTNRYRIRTEAGRRHGELLGPAAAALLDHSKLKAADIDAIVCPAGPGSFTGLRIAIAFAKGLQAAHDTPVFTVPTLTGLAWEHLQNGDRQEKSARWILPVIDGRKKRFYAALFDFGDGRADFGDGPTDPAERRSRLGKPLFGPVDFEPVQIIQKLDSLNIGETVTVCGYDAAAFLETLDDRLHGASASTRLEAGRRIVSPSETSPGPVGIARAMLDLFLHAPGPARKLPANEGPEYLRVSQAEE